MEPEIVEKGWREYVIYLAMAWTICMASGKYTRC